MTDRVISDNRARALRRLLSRLLQTVPDWRYRYRLAPWLAVLESVRKVYVGLQSFRSMRRIDARRRNASAL